MVIWAWVGFVILVILLLALDLGVLNRKAHVIRTREALLWTGFWVVLALLFNSLVYLIYENHWLDIGLSAFAEPDGREAALKFFTGFLIEKSLGMDNIFVIALVLAYFRVPLMYQHRVLFWGILGAIVLRGAMILGGAALVHRFDWVLYVFGGLLIVTAVKMLFSGEQEIEPDRNPLVRIARRFYPVTTRIEGQHFFVRENGRRAMTPLFLALLIVESSDVLFAIDSIPAIFIITADPFIVFTSNIFAILGLRSLFFALASLMDKFRYLKFSLVFLLAYVGVKMLVSGVYKIPIGVSLSIIVGLLAAGILASIFASRRGMAQPASLFGQAAAMPGAEDPDMDAATRARRGQPVHGRKATAPTTPPSADPSIATTPPAGLRHR
ncbi:MAG: TerC family protein [Phycisphaerae bacterium]|nr:TerC family protein [Phycisphaerae bacterium]